MQNDQNDPKSCAADELRRIFDRRDFPAISSADPETVRDYMLVQTGDSYALVPCASKIYEKVMHALLNNSLEHAAPDFTSRGICHSATLAQLSDSYVLALLSRHYDQPVIPTTGCAFLIFGENARRYASRLKKVRMRALNRGLDNS